jgi:hypothetical protein
LLVVGETIYILDGSTIQSVPSTGGALATRSIGLNGATDMVSDGSRLYVRNGQAIWRYDLSTFNYSFITAVESTALGVDGTSVYWFVRSPPNNAGDRGWSLLKVPKT